MGTVIKLFEPIAAENNGKFSVPVDFIRVIAMFLVVFLHVTNAFYYQSTQPMSDPAWWTFTVYKSIALPSVPLFVMLTGALLLQPSKVNEPIGVFLKKRLSRLGVAFAFWSIIYLAWGFYVTKTPLDLYSVLQGLGVGLISGPYYQFWYLYLIAGLYLITPILRAVVAFDSQKLINYLMALWFIGVGLVPLVQLFTGFELAGDVFVLGGFVGYYILGLYMQKVQLRREFIYGFFILGLALTLASTWLMTFPLASFNEPYFFFDYTAAGLVIMSFALYAALGKFHSDWPGSNHPKIGKVVKAISNNTLPIFLFHVIILEALRMGFLGFTLDLTVLPLVEIPLAAIAIFFITLVLVLAMKRVPILKKLIG